MNETLREVLIAVFCVSLLVGIVIGIAMLLDPNPNQEVYDPVLGIISVM